MPTNARVNVQKDNVTDALSSSVVVPTGKALTIASGGSLTAQAGSIVSIPASGITGLGTMATQNANNVAITGGSITGITDLAVADGGTGTSSLTGYVKGAGTTPLTASSTIPNTDITGLGTMSTQNANSVAITGGSITGITDLAVADGGTGASNAANARINLGVSTTGTSILYGDGAGSFSNVTIGSGVSFTGGTLSATGTGGTVTTVSVTTANGVSGTVTNPTTTPAISLTLGAITPTSVNSVTLSGSATPTLAVTGASAISGTNTGDQTISITGDVTAAGSQNTLTSTVTRINGQALATLATGILKNTTSTGVPSIAVAADFPTLNQNTTGNAATATNVAVTGVTGLGTGVASFLQTPTSANLSSMVVDETGSGNLVFANSPVLVTPNLDTPSVLTLTNATGLPLSSGVTGTLPVSNGGTGVTTSTGTGSTVLSDSPTLTGIPAAPTAAVGTNTTQIATTQYVQSNRGDKYLTTSNSTNTINNGNGKVFNCAVDLSYIPTQPVTIVYDVNNHMHGFVVSYNITTGVMVVDIDSHTGSGTYSAWTINIGGLTSVGGALLSANNLSDVASVATSRANLGVTATGQDTTYLYRINNLSDLDSVSTARTNLGLGTMATQNSTNVSISGGTLASVTLTTPTISSITNTGTLTLPNQTDTLVGRATTDTLTNKTLTSPVMTTPSLGAASATSINKVAITAPATGSTLTIADGATLTASATATVSGTNTGDQTISITGDVTASGSTGVLTSTVTKINGTSLAGLATGILKNTTGTGVPSIAVSGSDYAPATSGSSILYGNGAGGFSNVTIGSGVAFSGGTLSATGNGGTVTSVSVTTANGVSGTVATSTTTPAISLTLGDITPSKITALNNTGSYQAIIGRISGGDRVGIAGQATGDGVGFVFFDVTESVFRPSIFDASSHSFKISGVATTSITSTGFQGAIGATTASTVAATTIAASGNITRSGLIASSPAVIVSGTDTVSQAFLQVGIGAGAGGNVGVRVVMNDASTGGKRWDIASGGVAAGVFSIRNSTDAITAFQLTNTGINSTAIGATSASTGNFTTLHQGTAGAQGLAVGFSGAAGQGFSLRDTTNSRTYFITTETATGLQINAGANPITLIGNTNVTGALSATGNILGSGTYVGISNPTYPLTQSNGIGAAFRSFAGLDVYGVDYRRWTGTATEHSVAYIGQYPNAVGGYSIGIYYDASKATNTQATTRIVSIDQLGVAITGALNASGNITASGIGSDNAGFFGLAGTSHRFSLQRYDTISSGSALLSAFGSVGIMAGATGSSTSGTLVGTFTSSGNVGIGTANPTVRLHIDNGSGVIVAASSQTSSQVVIGVGTLTAGRPFVGTNTNTNPLEIGTRAAQDLIFVTDSTERARISSTGVQIFGTLSATGIIYSTAGGEIPLRISGGGTGAQLLRIQTTGGDYFFGAERSAGNYYILGSTGYDAIIRAPSGIAFSANNGDNMQMRLSSSGLAITGALDVTSTIGLIRLNSSADLDTTGYGYISYRDNSTGSYTERAYVGFGAGNGNFNLYSGAPGKVMTLGADGVTSVLTISATGLAITGALSCTGALSKGSGSFRIEHPLPEKSATHQLVHSFIEGPQADLIYRGKVVLVDGKASVNLDTAATMTEGTFEVLCRDVQCFTTNETGWTAVRGKVTGNILTIEAKDADCVDEISWMVIGERKDAHMMETDWTDDNGKVIVEPLKPVTESK